MKDRWEIEFAMCVGIILACIAWSWNFTLWF